jgi:hypothetical protein
MYLEQMYPEQVPGKDSPPCTPPSQLYKLPAGVKRLQTSSMLGSAAIVVAGTG